MDPNNLKLKDVAVAVTPTAGLIAGIVLVSNGYTVIGSLILIPVILVFAVSFYKMPVKKIAEHIAETEETKKKSGVGRVQLAFDKMLDYLSNLHIVFIVGLFIWWYFIK